MIKLPETNKNVISILSGGLDSTILTHMLSNKYGNDKVIALSFNYGQRHSNELEKAKLTCDKLNIKHQIIDISFLNDIVKNVCALGKDTDLKLPEIKDVLGDPQSLNHVPCRNLSFTWVALSFAESNNADKVFLGIQSNDCYGFWDCTKDFTNNINQLTKLNRKTYIELVTPFVDFDKKEEILLAKELNVPFEDSWTCYRGIKGNQLACGKCASCAERIANFARAGLKDPQEYEIEIDWNNLIEKMKGK